MIFKNKALINKKISVDSLLSFNWALVLLVLTIASIGFIILYSAAEGNLFPWAGTQMIRFVVLFPVVVIIAVIDIRFWYKSAYLIYFVALCFIIVTELYGTTAMGATRWIRIGGFSLQPSEPMKICLVLALARYYHDLNDANLANPLYLVVPGILIIFPAILVFIQPDLGTAIIISAVGGVLLFVAGVSIWFFVTVGGAFLILAPLAFEFLLRDYQRNRVFTFLDPEKDPLGNGYNLLQSIIAVGSGGLTGKGLLHGTQSQLSFLPEKQTDFIFTMLSEELGFVGSISIVFLFFLVIWCGLIIAINSASNFGKLIAAGVTSILFFHVFINIAMVIGLLPIVGVPLPLLSYGGTMMMTAMVSFGLLLNSNIYSHELISKQNRKVKFN